MRESKWVRGELMMTYYNHYKSTKGTLLNTKTHVASLGYGAVNFMSTSENLQVAQWTFWDDPRIEHLPLVFGLET